MFSAFGYDFDGSDDIPYPVVPVASLAAFACCMLIVCFMCTIKYQRADRGGSYGVYVAPAVQEYPTVESQPPAPRNAGEEDGPQNRIYDSIPVVQENSVLSYAVTIMSGVNGADNKRKQK